MKKWIIVATGVLLIAVVYLQFRSDKIKPLAPKVPVVSSCKELKPGMRRIAVGPGLRWRGVGAQADFQFDIPIERFTPIKDFSPSDAPGGPSGFSLRLRNSASLLEIWWDPEIDESMKPAVNPALIYSGPVEPRKILDDEGSPVGEDSWGYWDNGEFWRRVRLRRSVIVRYGSINPGDVASYGSVHEQDAELFDQVISSVCFLSASGS